MSDTCVQVQAEKTPGDVCDFVIDYTTDLEAVAPNDTLATSSWVKVGNIVIDDDTGRDDTRAWVWVSGGGRVGEISRLVNTVTTVGGRQFVRTLIVKMVTALAKRPEDPIVEIEEVV